MNTTRSCPKSATETMFPSQIYLGFLHISKPITPASWDIVNGTWENIPSILTSIPPSFLLLQHKPSQENNKQMSGMGMAPSESSQVLRQAGITAPVPRLEGRRQASAWLSQSLSRTRKTWQKSPLPVTLIPQLTGSTHPLAQVWTHKPRVKQLFLQGNHHCCSILCTMYGFETSNSPWLGTSCLRWAVLTVE